MDVLIVHCSMLCQTFIFITERNEKCKGKGMVLDIAPLNDVHLALYNHGSGS